jgi:hypothetical protein
MLDRGNQILKQGKSCSWKVQSILSFKKERGMMSRQQKFIQLPLVGTILLCLLVGVYLFTSKHSAKPEPEPDASANIIKHSVNTHPDDALKYWTKDKMRKAKATNQPNVDTVSPEKQHLRRPPV